LPTVFPANATRFTVRVLIRSISRKALRINSTRGAVLATTRQCFCERIPVVIYLLLYVTHRYVLMCVAHQSEFIQGCVDPLRMDAWLALKTAYRLGRVP